MEPIRTLIVDDEPLAQDTVRLLLEDRADIDIVGVCANGREAVEAIRTERPDLVFLDVQMPEMDGFGVIQAIGPERMPVVVFATAYDQYALRAFEAQAFDYLLKPFDDERFEHVLRRAVEQVRGRSLGSLSTQLLGLLQDLGRASAARGRDPAVPYLERIMVRSKDAVEFVATDDVAWIEAAGDYIVLHAGSDEHLLRETMQGILDQLDPRRFVRIHRSTIVNVDCIRKLQPYFHGDYIVRLRDGTELKLSRRYWEHVEQVLGGKY